MGTVAHTYYQRRWDESRGDEWDSWGRAVYLFEVNHDGVPLRQVEQYETGPTLRYGPGHIEDAHGFLSAEVLDPDEWRPFNVPASTFDTAWSQEP